MRLLDPRSLAEDLRRATNHELADFLAVLDEGTRDWLTDRLYPIGDGVEDQLEEAETEIRGLKDDNRELERKVDELEDRVAELESSPSDCILLAWDLSQHCELPDLKKARPADLRDQLAAFSQFISRAYLVAPERPHGR
jgi:predicted nuclease with TOPRIM domain